MTYIRRARGLVNATCIGYLVSTLNGCDIDDRKRAGEEQQTHQGIEATLGVPFIWDYRLEDNTYCISLLEHHINFLDDFLTRKKKIGGKRSRLSSQSTLATDVIERAPGHLFDEEKHILHFLKKNQKAKIYISITESTYILHALDNRHADSLAVQRLLCDRLLPRQPPFDMFLFDRMDPLMLTSANESHPREGEEVLYTLTNIPLFVETFEHYARKTFRFVDDFFIHIPGTQTYSECVNDSLEAGLIRFIRENETREIVVHKTNSEYIFTAGKNQSDTLRASDFWLIRVLNKVEKFSNSLRRQ